MTKRTKEELHQSYIKWYEKLKSDPERYKVYLEKEKLKSKEEIKKITKRYWEKVKSDPIKYKKYLEDTRRRYQERKADPVRNKKAEESYKKSYIKKYGKHIKLLNEFGSKCSICGYNKNYSVLEFHHLDPLLKEFSIGNLKNGNYDKALNEAKKCVLLCSNCHKELHHPDLTTTPLA